MPDPPAHRGLIPRPLDYVYVTDHWAHIIADASGTERIERASHDLPSPLGYYSLTLTSGQRLFGKVVRSADTQRIVLADRLASETAARGVPSQRMLCLPRPIGDDYHLFLYEWIDGFFASGSDKEMEDLGKVVALLHSSLREASMPQQTCSLPNQWLMLRQLAGSGRLDMRTAAGLSDLLMRQDEIEAQLQIDAQRIHNDLHVGNVMFHGNGDVAAILDFEDALNSFGCPLIDLSWVLERFCFLGPHPKKANILAARFLAAYFSNANMLSVRRGALLDLIHWRSFLSLAILEKIWRTDSPSWCSEWSKFVKIISRSEQWRHELEKLEFQFMK